MSTRAQIASPQREAGSRTRLEPSHPTLPSHVPGPTGPRAALLHLQRTAGNQAISQVIQAKLRENQRSNTSEQDAEQQLATGLLTPGSGGRPLPEAVRQKMEAAFGQDFSQVRIHEDPAVRSIGANAYTKGNHIHFAPGEYQPERAGSQRLLGHELTHVVQQRLGHVPLHNEDGLPINNDQVLESEADSSGYQASLGQPVSLAVSLSGHAPSGQGVMQFNGGGLLEKLKGKFSSFGQGAKEVGTSAGTALINRQLEAMKDFSEQLEDNPVDTEIGTGPAIVQELALKRRLLKLGERFK